MFQKVFWFFEDIFWDVYNFIVTFGEKRHPDYGPELAGTLDRLGYFSDLSSNRAKAIKKDMESNAFACMDHPLRVFITDAEELAECGVGEWFENVAEALKARGVDLGKVEDINEEDDDDTEIVDDYKVRIKGRIFPICSRPEAKENSGGFMWAYSFARTFMAANVFLQEAGCPDRFHGQFGTGNDGYAWLVTPDQAEAINQLTGLKPQERIVIMTDTPPLFGITLNR